MLKSINDLHSLCASAKEHDLESAINALPEMQQIAVRACFKAANKPANGRRHSLEWIYECLLMRIQNSNAVATHRLYHRAYLTFK